MSGPLTPTEGEYQGDKYVYTAHADPPFDDEILKSVNKLSGNFTYISVIGGLTGIDLLSSKFTPERIIFFDINPWMIDFCKMVLEIISMSHDRLNYIHRMTQNESVYNNSRQDTFNILSKSSKCVYKWLLQKKTKVCEDILLHHDPKNGPKLNPHNIDKKRNFSNTCSFYFNNGWLASEKTFNIVKRKISKSIIDFKHLNVFNNASKIYVNSDSVLYISNVFWHNKFKNFLEKNKRTFVIERTKLKNQPYKSKWLS